MLSGASSYPTFLVLILLLGTTSCVSAFLAPKLPGGSVLPRSGGARARRQARSSMAGGGENSAEGERNGILPPADLSAYEYDTKLIKGGYRGSEWSTDPLGRSTVNPPM